MFKVCEIRKLGLSALTLGALMLSVACTTTAPDSVAKPALVSPVAEVTPKVIPKTTAVPTNYDGHRLGPGDLFKVTVFGESELTGNYRVDSDGTSSFPLIGRENVNGQVSLELAQVLVAKYAEFIKKPRVSVTVTEANSQKIYIFGQVKKPGTFAYEAGMNIIHAITLAGGFEVVADQNGTYINRVVDGEEKRLQISVKSIGQGKASNVLLNPGDIIYVPESIF